MSHAFSADRPIETIGQDRLGRDFFAKHLADAVGSWQENDSLVLALYGEWGVGKTSVKNLFKCYCKQKGDPYMVEFNPWQWSAQDKIFEAFFQTIGERLGKRDVSKENRQLAKKWKFFAASLEIGAEVTRTIHKATLSLLLIASISAWLSTMQNLGVQIIGSIISVVSITLGGLTLVLPRLFQRVGDYFECKATYLEKDSEERREDLIAELKKLRKPLIVIIDDIDRLNRDEIRLVIQLIKANSNLPKVVFFLLFQQETVAKALDEISEQKGDEYFKKIVQIGFDIPKAQESKLHKMLFDGLSSIFEGLDFGSKWDKNRWESLFEDSLRHFFRTPRDVHRFLSMLRFHFEIYKNGGVIEVNPIDLIGIEVLRVFHHPVYERIRDSFVVYTDTLMRTLYLQNVKSQKIEILMDKAIEGLDPVMKKPVEEIVLNLFPQARPYFTTGDGSTWDKDLRICDKKHFSKYFELSLREGMVSELEISLLLKAAANSDTVSQIVSDHIKRGQTDELISRIDQYVESLPCEVIESFLIGLLSASDDLVDQKVGSFDFPVSIKLARITRRLLLRVEENSRIGVATKVFLDSKALNVPSLVVDADGRKNDADQSVTHLFNESALKIARQICVENIKAASQTDRLPKDERFLWLLQCWKQWTGTNEVENWVKSYLRDTPSALRLTMSAVQVSTASDHPGVQYVDELMLRWLEQYVDLNTLWGFLANIAPDTIGKREQAVISLFRKGLELKKNGKPYERIQ